MDIDLTVPELADKVGTKWYDGLLAEFKRGWEFEKATYAIRQGRIGQAVKATGTGAKHANGLGQLRACIDARTYFRWMQEDRNFWSDKSNREKFFKDNPEVLVKNWIR